MSEENINEEVNEEEEFEESEAEEQARAQGWVPEDEYKGDKKNWKTAEKFLEDGEKINAVLKDRNEKLLKDIADIKRQMGRKDTTLQNYVKYAEEQKKKALEKQKKDLLRSRNAAIADQDVDTVTSIESEIEDIDEQISASDKYVKESSNVQEEIEESPEFTKWREDNPWYDENEEMALEANVIGNQLFQTGAYKTEPALLNAMTRRIKQLFPEKFQSSTQQTNNEEEDDNVTQDVESGKANRGRKKQGRSKKKGYNDLPPDAKAACDEFCATIKGFTKEKYLQSYEWE